MAVGGDGGIGQPVQHVHVGGGHRPSGQGGGGKGEGGAGGAEDVLHGQRLTKGARGRKSRG